MRYVLGIDLGTSGTKTALFNEQGKLVYETVATYEMLQPKNGWAEQDPVTWWDAAVTTVSEVVAKSRVDPADIVGVGFSGQMHGLVLMDEAGEVVRPAILWCDGRTSEECREITETLGLEKLLAISGNPALTGFTAGKLLWVRKHEPENYARARKLLLPKDYVRYMLTGEYAIDAGDASGTNLLDIRSRDWSDEILSALDIDRSLLPKVYESCDVVGQISKKAAKLTGLKAGTPVVCGSGDNASAAVGTGVVTEGLAFTTIGTSGVVYAHSKEPFVDPKGRIHTFCSAVPGEYALMSCTLAAGQSLKWFKDNFCSEERAKAEWLGAGVYDILGILAGKSPVGANRLVYLPYLMGERSPILDENSRGVFFGLSSFHTKNDMIRAIMEGVTYSQRACFEVFASLGVRPGKMMACGGGAKSPLWRQMLADNYGCGISTIVEHQGPVLGAALMAAVGAGIYDSLPQACAAVVKVEEPQLPIPANRPAYDAVYSIYDSLYPALKDSFHKLARLDD